MTANRSVMRECLELILMWADALERQRAKSVEASQHSLDSLPEGATALADPKTLATSRD
jgi:hypothetical protein